MTLFEVLLKVYIISFSTLFVLGSLMYLVNWWLNKEYNFWILLLTVSIVLSTILGIVIWGSML